MPRWNAEAAAILMLYFYNVANAKKFLFTTIPYTNKGPYPMNSRIMIALAIAASMLVVTACEQSNLSVVKSNVQPTPAAPHAAVPAATATSLTKSSQLVIQGFASQIPSIWTPSEPSSTMRVAQFDLPPAVGSDAGEVAAYFFPDGQGGSHEANIERWTSQFSSVDGKPVAPKISTGKSGDTEVTLVELQGAYARGIGMGPTGDAKPDQTLLIAMVETSIGRITLQMYGPSATVSAQRGSFFKLAKGFRPA